MIKSIIVLPDGTEISSGAPRAAAAIQRIKYTESVNSGEELTLGSVCSNMLEATLLVPQSTLTLAAGMTIVYYQAKPNGKRTLVGTFTLETPTQRSANVYQITAYDAVAKTDKDLSPWLHENQGMFPITLYDFAKAVCLQCGVALTNTELPNGSWKIRAFYADDLTGRKLLQWVGQACGRFCRATPGGALEFAWFAKPADAQTFVPGKGMIPLHDAVDRPLKDAKDAALMLQGNTDRSRPYFQNGLTYRQYQVAPIDKVMIQCQEDDVGAVWPPDERGTNAYKITGNYLLLADTAQALYPVAQTLYNHLRSVQPYTPCTVLAPAMDTLRAGDIIEVQTPKGTTLHTYVFTRTLDGQKENFACTGSSRRDSSTATNHQELNLRGQMLLLKTSVDGLKVTAVDLGRRQAALELTADGLAARVESSVGKESLYDSNFENEPSTPSVQYEGGIATIKPVSGRREVSRHITDIAKTEIPGHDIYVQLHIWQDADAVWYNPDSYGYVSANLRLTFEGETDPYYYNLFQTRTTLGDAVPKVPANPTMYRRKIHIINKKIQSIDLYLDAQNYNGYLHGKWFSVSYGGEVYSLIEQSIHAIKLEVAEDDRKSTLTLKAGNAVLSSSEINLEGLVKFTDLSTEGATTILGDNIKTGRISANATDTNNTYFDLNAGELVSEYKTQAQGMLRTYLSAGKLVTSVGKDLILDIGPTQDPDAPEITGGHLYLSGPLGNNYWGVKLGIGTAGGGLLELISPDGYKTISMEGGNGMIYAHDFVRNHKALQLYNIGGQQFYAFPP